MSNAQTQTVSIFGPNLRDQSKGTFHVHSADCGDICKMRKREPMYAHPLTLDAENSMDVVTAVYDPSDFDWDPMDADEFSCYAAEFHFYPCCSGIDSI